MKRGSAVMVSFSSTISCTPIAPSSSMVVVTSCRCGTLPIEIGPSASSVAARMGSTAFLAPEICTSPFSGSPPVITIFAMWSGVSGLGGLVCFFGCQCAQGQGVDFAAHLLAQRGIDHAVAGQRQLAGEGVADHGGLEMHPVVAANLGAGAGQAGFDEFLDDLGIHGRAGRGGRAGLTMRPRIIL